MPRKLASDSGNSKMFNRCIPDPTLDEIQVLDGAFHNRHSYDRRSDECMIPNVLFTSPHWEDAELQEMKKKLNAVKSKLDNIEIERWQEHTQNTNRAAFIMNYIRGDMSPELSTQAWFKFYEILGRFPELVKPDGERLNSVHLCEAPGAFIASLQHFLLSRELHRENWKWLASTLNPNYEGNDVGSMIDNDQFILGTRENWCFGADETGDIMNIRNIEYIKKDCTERGLDTVDLITCDGSIDCANDPAEQEKNVSHLIYCEIVASFCLLSPSGCLVVKMFTMFEETSICSIFLLCCLFEKVHVLKPVTSKPGNSEVYVVALNFIGIKQDLLDQLKKYIGPEAPSAAMFPMESIPELFLEQHRNNCRKFSDFQERTIRRNLELFPCNAEELKEELRPLQEQFYKKYVQMFEVKRISPKRLRYRQADVYIRLRKLHGESHAKRRHRGSFSARHQVSRMSSKDTVLTMEQFYINREMSKSQVDVLGEDVLGSEMISEWKPRLGKKYDVLRSSKFCELKYLQEYLKLLKYAKELNLSTEDIPEMPFRLFLHDFVAKLQEQGLESQNCTIVVDAQDVDFVIKQICQEELKLRVCSSGETCLTTDMLLCGQLSKTPENDIEKILNVEPEILDLLRILKETCEGCHCLISTGPLLTRLHASMLCLIYSCFSSVTVYRAGSSSSLYIAGWKFRRCSLDLLNYLCKASKVMLGSSEDDYRLLELIPMSVLYDEKFFDFIFSVNAAFVRLRFNHLLQQLREFYKDMATAIS